MRQWKRAAVLMMLLLLLSGCGKEKTMQQALEFRQRLLQMNNCTFLVSVTADYAARSCTFSLDCDCTPEETRLTVTEPDTISGITATVTEDGRKVRFDDLSLEFGTLGTGKIAPVCAPAVLYQCWLTGYIDSAGMEGDQQLVVYRQGYDQEELMVRCWFDQETGLPTGAEICDAEDVILTMDISEFTDCSNE